MNWLIERQLKKIAQRVDPDPHFTAALETRLKTTLGHPFWWIRARVWLMAGLTVLTVAGSATSVYAYTSDDVVPDHPLYALRQTIESVEIVTAFTPAQKVQVTVNHLERRIKEQRVMKARHRKISPTTLSTIQKELNTASDDDEKTSVQPGSLQKRIQHLKKQSAELLEE